MFINEKDYLAKTKTYFYREYNSVYISPDPHPALSRKILGTEPRIIKKKISKMLRSYFNQKFSCVNLKNFILNYLS